MQPVPAVLVDARNFDQLLPQLVEAVSTSDFLGIDCETHDIDAHQGIKDFRGSDTARVFDINRTTMTGLSIWPEGHHESYYINLAHADIENRVSFSKVRPILDAKRDNAHWIAHNAPFELVMFNKCHGYPLTNIICSMQMAVTAYNPDEYDVSRFIAAGVGGFYPLLGEIAQLFEHWDVGSEMTGEQADMFYKVVAKESDAKHSYNGFVKDISYGYGLKKAVESHFGVKMTTYNDALQGKAHMGELTGEEVCNYGADDAFWAVKLFRFLMGYMAQTNPKAIKAFFEQENPMVEVYAETWAHGIRVNTDEVAKHRLQEAANAAQYYRDLKAVIKRMLPYPAEPNEGLMQYDSKWYEKNWQKYRKRVEDWAKQPDSDDDLKQIAQVSGPVTKEFVGKSTGPNLTHYMPMRSILYDLTGERPMREGGKVQSDKDAREIFSRRKTLSDDAREMLRLLKELASIEQRMKLYLAPYTKLIDPDTNMIYPSINSMLATRRMAGANPNPMQCAKRGESSYVRGFYKADEDEHVLISIDWRNIELVLIGEMSGDPEFARCFGTLPYEDLHAGAAADCLGMTEEEFDALDDDLWDQYRVKVGKGANFNYWYSGALATVGQNLGWSSDKMWEATDRYRQRFAVAEAWRVNTINQLREDGYLDLPDGTRRSRFEATMRWQDLFLSRFDAFKSPGMNKFFAAAAKRISRRAGNQGINALIQGTCATLAKRSIIGMRKRIKADGFRARPRFYLPVHDELLYSVHYKEAIPFLHAQREVMLDHPDIIKNLKIDCSVAIGRTMQPFHSDRAPFGQIELDEAPGGLSWVSKGERMTDAQIQNTVDYLFEDLRAAA